MSLTTFAVSFSAIVPSSNVVLCYLREVRKVLWLTAERAPISSKGLTFKMLEFSELWIKMTTVLKLGQQRKPLGNPPVVFCIYIYIYIGRQHFYGLRQISTLLSQTPLAGNLSLDKTSRHRLILNLGFITAIM